MNLLLFKCTRFVAIPIILLVFAFSPVALVSVSASEIDLEIGLSGQPAVTGITNYIGTIYLFASGIVAGLAAVMIVIGGIQYATAAGNQKGIAQAKETITSAIIGLVIVGAGYLILETFGTQFTNLKEPSLPEVQFPDNENNTNKGSYYCGPDPVYANKYICLFDASGQKEGGGCSKDSVGGGCTTDGRPPQTEDCRELEATTEACESGSNGWCKLCVAPNGDTSCVKLGDNCGSNCKDNCMPDLQYMTCLTSRMACNSACSPLSENLSAVGCFCGSGKTDSRLCDTTCGYGRSSWTPDPNNPDFQNTDIGTCRCKDGRTLAVKESLAKCETNKAGWSQKCISDYSCGPGGPWGAGKDAYCCTDSAN